MPGSTGLLPLATRSPAQVIDVGIAEQHAVTCAAGMAHAGKLPIVAIYSTFFTRAFDQANLDVGLHDEHVVFVLDRAGVTGDDGAEPPRHPRPRPGAAHPDRVGAHPLVRGGPGRAAADAVDLDGPVVVRFPKGAAVPRSALGPAADEPVTGLAARRLADGGDVCILAVGDRAAPALEAAGLLAEEGIEAAVWDVRSVRPADPAMLAAAAAAPLVVTVENGLVGGGAGAELSDRIVELAGVGHAPPVLRLGVPALYLPQGKPDRILAELGLDAAGIAAATRKVLADER
jgi:1-deoxy-D-xylulose-5-phosphate synthase